MNTARTAAGAASKDLRQDPSVRASPGAAAALAYCTVFSVAPLLLSVIALAGLLFGQEAARGEIMGQLSELMGD